jgi:hypothetical protein
LADEERRQGYYPANQLSAALAQVLAKLPQSVQLGLGGLALFGGLRPVTEAIYGPSINLSTAVTPQVDDRELGRVLVRQAV